MLGIEMTYRKLRLGLLAGVLVAACGGDAGDDAAITPQPDAAVEPVPARCSAPAGVDNAPRDIAAAVALVNALPKPLELPCFIEALARPLALHATRSVFSAQPAQGTRSPRMFLFYDPLVMSVVPAGEGSALLEFGEQLPDLTSIKGEIEFPVEAEVAPAAPYERIMFDETRTTCSFCHRGEEPALEAGVSGAFKSQALRSETRDKVGLDALRAERDTCDASLEPARCAMIAALLDQAGVEDRAFPQELDTFLLTTAH